VKVWWAGFKAFLVVTNFGGEPLTPVGKLLIERARERARGSSEA
jgi:hypothetical protein